MELPIGLTLGDKFKLLRKEEGLSQRAFCEIVGIPQTTLAGVETGKNKGINSELLGKIASNPRFFPYSMWLLVDELSPEQSQQILDFLTTVKAPENTPEP